MHRLRKELMGVDAQPKVEAWQAAAGAGSWSSAGGSVEAMSAVTRESCSLNTEFGSKRLFCLIYATLTSFDAVFLFMKEAICAKSK